jgi:hypothetical protein
METPRQYTSKKYKHRHSEAPFVIYSFQIIKENAQSIHLEFSCRHCSTQTSGKALFFHQNYLVLLTTIFYDTSCQSSCKVWLCRLGSIYMTHMEDLHHISFLSRLVIEKRVSGKMDRSRCINSISCSFLRCKSLGYLSLRTSEVHSLSYKSQ